MSTAAGRLTSVVHCKRQPHDVYIGRGPCGRHMGNTPVGRRGWLGNPYQVGPAMEAPEAIARFRAAFLERVDTDPPFRAAVLRLRGKVLGCWCAPGPCHGDVIAEWLDVR